MISIIQYLETQSWLMNWNFCYFKGCDSLSVVVQCWFVVEHSKWTSCNNRHTTLHSHLQHFRLAPNFQHLQLSSCQWRYDHILIIFFHSNSHSLCFFNQITNSFSVCVNIVWFRKKCISGSAQKLVVYRDCSWNYCCSNNHCPSRRCSIPLCTTHMGSVACLYRTRISFHSDG
jgi:hypothetical protein